LTNDTEVFAGFAFQVTGAKAADDFTISATGQYACEGMYSQAELDQLITNAVSQTEASKNAIIEEQNEEIAFLKSSILILEADIVTKDALLAANDAIIKQLKDELEKHKRSHHRIKFD